MNHRILIAGALVLGLGATGTGHAQTATSTSPSTPPERMNGSTTMDNPATATTPAPGSPSATGNAVGILPDAQSTKTPGAPIPGANSFTEGEARSRIENHGFAQVSDLKLDNQGIWRGNASKDGKNLAVALDYQGNVVAR